LPFFSNLLEHSVPAPAESVFKIGSIGKQFVASGIVILANEGKLSLDDSVRKYLDDAPASWEPVNFRRLLSHTSGIVRNALFVSRPGSAPRGGDEWKDGVLRNVDIMLSVSPSGGQLSTVIDLGKCEPHSIQILHCLPP
jgi:CubicO group peptidase (beta-lactamase class C family)